MSSRVQFLLQRAGLLERKTPLEHTPPQHRVQLTDPVPSPTKAPIEDSFCWPDLAADASIADKLNNFLRAYQEGTGAELSFVKDEQGLLLADTGASEDLSGAASRVGQALEIASDRLGGNHALGNAVIDVEGGQYLNLFWARSPIGLIGVGSITKKPISIERITQARNALSDMLG